MQATELFYDLGRYLGLAAFWGLALLIISGDLARYLDRFFGLDRIIKFQRKFSLFATALAVLHPAMFMLSTGSITGFIIPDFSIPPLAAGIVALYIFVAFYVASKLYKRISNQAWQYLHVVSYLLFFLSLYHALNWGSDSSNPLIKAAFAATASAVIIAIAYRTIHKIRKMREGHFEVRDLVKETGDVFTVAVKPPEGFCFKAGQFCFLRIDKGRLYARHPFTISSAPHEEMLRFTIKDTGAFTKEAGKLKKGDAISVEGPYGRFYLRDNKKDLIFIAGGVGITPFLSLLKDVLQNDRRSRNISLIYGSQKAVDIIAKGFLDCLPEQGIKLTYVLSQEERLEEGFAKGRINETIISENVRDIDNTLFYICGPAAMKDALKKILLAMGARKKDIIVEDFFW